MENVKQLSDDDLKQLLIKRWKIWQTEENRDRGYNFDYCKELREDYYLVEDEMNSRNLEIKLW